MITQNRKELNVKKNIRMKAFAPEKMLALKEVTYAVKKASEVIKKIDRAKNRLTFPKQVWM